MGFLRVLEKQELLSQVLAFMGEGTEIAAILVCKDLCNFVRLLRGWHEGTEKREESSEDAVTEEKMEKELKIVCGMSVSRVSCFFSSVSDMEWGVDVLGMPIRKRTTELAVKAGHVHILSWLLDRGVPLERHNLDVPWNPQYACRWAAEAGHLPMLQYLRNLDPPCPWETFACASAAKNGHLHVLKWARSQSEPCPWNWRTCAGAAENGHLHVLQWARSQPEPCPWDYRVCGAAARFGQVKALQWLRSQPEPCPLDIEHCARETRVPEVWRWLDSQEESLGQEQ